jgi:hypothetical protein
MGTFFPVRHTRMSRLLLFLSLLCLAGCSDSIAGPNTDVGLSVWAEALPASISIQDSTTPISLRVYVANPSYHVIRVVGGGPPYVSTGDPARTVGMWGSMRIGTDTNPLNAGPNADWFGDSVYVFAPRRIQYNERRITLRDWRAGGWAVLPGIYRVRGWFNAREGKSALLTLVP